LCKKTVPPRRSSRLVDTHKKKARPKAGKPHTPHPQPRKRDRSTGRRNNRRDDGPKPKTETTETAQRPAANHRRQPRGNDGKTDEGTRRTARRAARNRHNSRATEARDEQPTRRKATTRREGPQDNAQKRTTKRQAGDATGKPDDQTETRDTENTPRHKTQNTSPNANAHGALVATARDTANARPPTPPAKQNASNAKRLNDSAFAPRFCKRLRRRAPLTPCVLPRDPRYNDCAVRVH